MGMEIIEAEFIGLEFARGINYLKIIKICKELMENV